MAARTRKRRSAGSALSSRLSSSSSILSGSWKPHKDHKPCRLLQIRLCSRPNTLFQNSLVSAPACQQSSQWRLPGGRRRSLAALGSLELFISTSLLNMIKVRLRYMSHYIYTHTLACMLMLIFLSRFVCTPVAVLCSYLHKSLWFRMYVHTCVYTSLYFCLCIQTCV